MFIEFTVGNYRSFREPVTFSMLATPLKGRTREIDENNVFDGEGGNRLLTTAGIYGANASGKSNFVKALSRMRSMVLSQPVDSAAMDTLPMEPFLLDDETPKEPSHFEIVFVTDGTQYRYGFTADENRVVEEWLYHVPSKRETNLFFRGSVRESVREDDVNGKGFSFTKSFKEGGRLSKMTRPNALFLSVLAQFNDPIAMRVIRWFHEKLDVAVVEDGWGGSLHAMLNYTISQLDRRERTIRKRILELVKQGDLGIEGLSVDSFVVADTIPEDMPEQLRKIILEDGPKTGHRLLTQHSSFAEGRKTNEKVSFELKQHESSGTQKLIALSGPLLDALDNGGVFVMDEMDARLHPVLSRAVVGLFQDKAKNPHNAQLVFTTHDTTLLSSERFRRDQVWFAEKERGGATRLFSLAEFKGVRKRESFEYSYLRGKYGAIPIVREFGQPYDACKGKKQK